SFFRRPIFTSSLRCLRSWLRSHYRIKRSSITCCSVRRPKRYWRLPPIGNIWVPGSASWRCAFAQLAPGLGGPLSSSIAAARLRACRAEPLHTDRLPGKDGPESAPAAAPFYGDLSAPLPPWRWPGDPKHLPCARKTDSAWLSLFP